MGKIKYNEEDVISHHGIAAVIKDKTGNILMQNHIKYGFWTIPVGKVKQGQSVEEGLKQEILEECNLNLKKFRELVKRSYIYERDGHNVEVVSHLFEIINYDGEMRNNEPEKHKQQIFMPLEEIKNLPYLSDLTLLYLETLGFKRSAKI